MRKLTEKSSQGVRTELELTGQPNCPGNLTEKFSQETRINSVLSTIVLKTEYTANRKAWQRTLPASQKTRTKRELTDFDNLEGEPTFKIVLLSNLGWLPPIRLLIAQWWPIILIIVGVLLLIRHSSRPKP
jgi:hypothetical protein